MAENGVPEATMLAIVGHMSRKMLERYSHIRVYAKRDAMAGLSLSAPVTVPCAEVIPAKVPVMPELAPVN